MKSYIAIIVVILMTCMSQIALTCSVFSYADESSTMVGRNFDLTPDSLGLIRIVPADEVHYGMMIIEADQFGPQDGMNDQGLMFATAATPYFEIPENPDGLPLNMWVFWDELMQSCATVEEAVEHVAMYDLSSGFGYMNTGHFLFTDRFGSSAIVEGDTVFWMEDDHLIMTNYVLSQPELGNYPCPRYDVIEDRLTAPIEIDSEYFISIIEEVRGAAYSQWGGTTMYSAYYEPENLEVTFFWASDFENGVTINLAEELQNGEAEYSMEDLYNEGLNDDDDAGVDDAGIDDSGVNGNGFGNGDCDCQLIFGSSPKSALALLLAFFIH